MPQLQQPTPDQAHRWAHGWLTLRHRARTNLFFLANEVLAPPDSQIMTMGAHGCIVDHCQAFKGRIELLGKKNDPLRWKNGVPVITHSVPAVPIAELEGSRDNLLLVSRGHLKTTIHTVAHIIQWIINYPDIRILICTATDEKASLMVTEIKSHFQFNPRFRFMFPELCPDARKVSDWGSKTEFTVPGRNRRTKEPTVMTASVGKALASTHHDVIKCLSPQTFVHTSRGVETVSDLKIGSLALTHLGRYRRITRLAERKAECLKITFENLTPFPVECSVEHPFLTDQGWVEARELRIGDKIKRPVVTEETPAPIPYDPQLWKAFGWWIAEGSLIRGSRRIIYALHEKESEIANEIGAAFVAHGATGYYFKQQQQTKGIVLHVKRIPVTFRNALADMCIGPYRKQVPPWVLTGPKECLEAFLDGLWAGDGDRKYTLCSVSPEIIIGAAMGRQILAKSWSLGVDWKTRNKRKPAFFIYGKRESGRYTSDYSTVKAIEGIGEASVVSISVDEDETLCVPGAVTHNCSDVVTENNVKTQGQVQEVKDFFGYLDPLREKFESKDGQPNPAWLDIEGTIYDYCLIGETRILMADWTHKPISEIRVGDEVVGWDYPRTGKRLKRFLRTSKVIAVGKHEQRCVNRYIMASGRSVTSTPSHRWWKGKDWNKGGHLDEYAQLGLRRNQQRSLRSLLIPKVKLNSRDAGWLAGMYDGEGSFQKNTNYPSGSLNICQSMHNPGIIEELRTSFRRLGFRFNEVWHRPSTKAYAKPHHKDRCVFNVLGGWQERYRFIAEVGPYRDKKIKESLFANLQTERDDLVAIESAGKQDVYWFQCETGNYIAEGYCSKNSDYYQQTLDAKANGTQPWWRVTQRSCWVDRAKHIPLWPERFPAKQLERILAQIGPVLFASQYELNPVTAEDGLATPQQIKKFPAHLVTELMPRYRIHTTVDLSGMDPATEGDATVFSTCGFDRDGRCDVLSIIKGRFTLDQVVNYFFAIDQVYPNHADFKVQKDHFSRTLWPILQREQAKRGKWLNIQLTPVSTRISKQQRIRGLQAWFMQGLIRFADNITCMNDVVLEILRFPKYEHDDILDTLADQMHNRDGHPVSDVYPDAPKFAFGAPPPEDKFTGFDPITKDAKWLYNQIESAHAEYHPSTGAL